MTDDPRQKQLEQFQKDHPLTPELDGLIADDLRAHAGHGPAPRPAAQGIRDMEARLAWLRAEKAKTIDAMDGAGADAFNALLLELNRLNQQLEDAQQRLAEYQVQDAGQN